jgi:hypothetical protein
MTTCNRLDLGTLGSRPIMPKNLHRQSSMDESCIKCIMSMRFVTLITPAATTQENGRQLNTESVETLIT